ncbi:MAG: uracil-DNA glycosylase [Thermoprotei archaeon]|nr:uracil-DNA glycosylase [Thermoprotei archaeon]
MASKENTWEKIVREIKECKKCRLHKYRKNPVPGEGSLNAKIMFIGEAPGAKEDEQGRPFVGAAGKLLTTLLESIGLKRENVFITNVVKCRPPHNRDPLDDEISACLPYLVEQINIIKPRIIVTLGRISTKTTFQLGGLVFKSMSKDRGVIREAKIGEVEVKILPTYHPAAALYNPKLRSKIESDFKALAKIYKSIEEGSKKKYTLLDFLREN